ncbi:hypothetical protein [Lacibacter sp. H407]|uniref:hypothetical protein n=1 Tax=Lacibacter sp. H407 TaxID=3133423 RepID=UPI0030C3359A
MNLFRLFVTGSLLLLSVQGFTQSFNVPANYELKQPSDFVKYEKDIIEASVWLRETAFDEQKAKRKEVSAFIFSWISGSPSVNVELNEVILDFDKKNSGMMLLFMAGCARYVLENNYSKDIRAKQRAGLRDMVHVYKAGKGIKKDKKMDKLVKSDEEGTLDAWLDENLKINPR